jgi:acyl carrier protein
MTIDFQNLHTFIAEQLLNQPGLALSPDTCLITSGLVDSFHRVDLALFIEDHYGVKIDDTELNGEAFDSLEQLEALILQRAS